jgi:hypothetical protein
MKFTPNIRTRAKETKMSPRTLSARSCRCVEGTIPVEADA